MTEVEKQRKLLDVLTKRLEIQKQLVKALEQVEQLKKMKKGD